MLRTVRRQAESRRDLAEIGLGRVGRSGLLWAISHLGRRCRSSIRIRTDGPFGRNRSRERYPWLGFRKAGSGTVGSVDRRPFCGQELLARGHVVAASAGVPEAEKCLREALRLRPDDPETLNNLGTRSGNRAARRGHGVLPPGAISSDARTSGSSTTWAIALWEQDRPERRSNSIAGHSRSSPTRSTPR